MAQSVNDGFNPNANGMVASFAVQADGRILAAGDFTQIAGASRTRIARLNVGGSLDTTFDPGAGANATVQVVVVQSDGKVLIGGDFTSVGGQARNRLARLNADGSLDTAFDPAAGANGTVQRLALQPDGKLLVAGAFSQFASEVRCSIARVEANGNFDATFVPPTCNGKRHDVMLLALQSDGRMLIAGDGAITRLHVNGDVDASFFNAGGGNPYLTGLAIQADGKVLVGGQFTEFAGQTHNHLVRLNANGSLDNGFNPDVGGSGNPFVGPLLLQPDGKILLGGAFTLVNGQTRNSIARLNADGSLDAAYYPTGGSNGLVLALALQADGSMFAGGTFTQFGGQARNRIVRLNLDGSVDADLSLAMTGTGVSAAVEQPDGKLLVGGTFSIASPSRTNFARLNADGSVDAGYVPASPNGSVINVTPLPDGKVLLAGSFTKVGAITRNRIARLNADGSLDAGFDPGSGADDDIYSVYVEPNGAIVIGGLFSNFNGVVRNDIARVNPNGSLDSAFDPNVDASVRSLARQPDGSFVVAGYFDNVGSAARTNIARIKADGTLDTGFYPAGGTNSLVYDLLLQADGKVLLGGMFTSVGGATRNKFARLNTDATVDAFYPGGGFTGGDVMSLALQTNGNVLVGGSFSQVGGTARSRIARLKAADGSLDANFYPTSGINNIVASVVAQSNGKVLLGGFFSQAGGVARTRLARLGAAEPALQNLDIGADRVSVRWLRSGGGPELQRVWFERSVDGVAWSQAGEGVRSAGGWSLGGLTFPRNQNVWVRARGAARGGFYTGSTSLIESVRQAYLRTLTVTTILVGQGTATVSTPTLDPGGTSVITVTPAAGWYLVSLSGDTCTPSDNGDGTWAVAVAQTNCVVKATFAAQQTTTTLNLAQGTTPNQYGNSLTFAASVLPVAPATATPTGTVTFFDSDGITPIAGCTNPATLDAGGTVTCTTTALPVGAHSLTARYSGDTNYPDASTSSALAQLVSPANSSVALAMTPAAPVFGQSSALNATVSTSHASALNGSVTFKEGANVVPGCGAVALSGASASCAGVSLPVGLHTISATYSGDTNTNGSTDTKTLTVAKATTAVTLPSAMTITLGSPLSVSASVAVVAPGAAMLGGTIAISSTGGDSCSIVLPAAQCTFTPRNAGSRTLSAIYTPDAATDPNVTGSSNTGSLTVNPAASGSSLSSSVNPSVFGEAVTFTGTVTPASGGVTPTGQVALIVDGTTICTQSLSPTGVANAASANCALQHTPLLDVGAHTVSLNYGGDANNAASSTTLAASQTVTAAQTTTTIAPLSAIVLGQPVSVSVTVAAQAPGSGTPTGAVTVRDGSASCVATLSNGSGTCTLTPPAPAGSHSLSATYAATTDFAASSGSIDLTVKPAAAGTTVISSANPSVGGKSVTFTATVTATAGNPVPAGSMDFRDGADVLCSAVALTGGSATCSSSSLGVGPHVIKANYGGDTNTAASSATLEQVVNSQTATLTLTSSANPSRLGDSVTFTATVSTTAVAAGRMTTAQTPAIATGTVEFSDDDTPLGTVAVDNGSAQTAVTFARAGTHTITARYSGDAFVGPQSGSMMQTVQAVPAIAVPAPMLSPWMTALLGSLLGGVAFMYRRRAGRRR